MSPMSELPGAVGGGTATLLQQVGETMFPGITQTVRLRSKAPELRLGHEIVSDLPLQVCLFFNACYFPFWLACELASASAKYQHLNYLYKIVLVTVLVAVVLIEVTRLYLGYLGNLTEKVPELAGFWLLTVLLQFPLQGFLLLNGDLILLPLERAACAVMFCMILAELWTGFVALRRITRHQAKKFHLMQMRYRGDAASAGGGGSFSAGHVTTNSEGGGVQELNKDK